VRLAAAVVLFLAGALWALQGVDVAFAPKSSMTGDRVWLVWGVIAMASGIGLAWWEIRSK
jgi:hypothetical protein